MRVLVLGGTAEASALAAALADRGIKVVTSLAGRTREPAPIAGAVRVGGFGGATGLATYLSDHEVSACIDATHPFATEISRNAFAAATLTGVPLLHLVRPEWAERSGDDWLRVPTLETAAQSLPIGVTALLALGRQHLHVFGARRDVKFVVRSIEPLPRDVLPQARRILSRPSKSSKDEAEFFRRENVQVIVSRNSGGPGAYAKIVAARELGLRVVMIDRELPPPGPRVSCLEDCVEWIAALQSGGEFT